MKHSIKNLLIAAGLGLWANAASAHHIAGEVLCVDTSPAVPLSGITVTVQGTQNTFTTQTVGGYYIVELPTLTDTYTVSIAAPPGTTLVNPPGGVAVLTVYANGVGGPSEYNGVSFWLTGCSGPRPSAIGDTVYCDVNGNRTQDPGEPGIPGVKVNLVCIDGAGNTNTAQAITDANGKYLFTNVPPGVCVVRVDTSSVTGDCNFAVCATTVSVTLAAGQIYLDADFCFQRTPPPELGQIGDTVYCDTNGNGTQDPGEPGIPGVKVNLVCIDAAGNTNATAQAITDANGKYLFTDVPAGTCVVTVDTSSVTGDCNIAVCATSVTVDLGVGEIYLDADFCFTAPPEGPGTGTPGYWKNHPAAWPVDSIVIGGRTYTKAQAIQWMNTPERGDKTLTVFRHLVSAKLNVLIGNASGCIDSTIADADAWMAVHPVGSGVGGGSAAWAEISDEATLLDNYNNGLLCAPHRD